MTTRAVFRSLALLGGVLSAAPAWCATQGSAYAGVEIGNTDSSRVDAGGAVRFLDEWNANVSLSRARVEFPDARTNSTSAIARLGYDFGAISVGGGYRHGEIEEVSRTRGWFVAAGYEHRELRFGLEVESRSTTLEPAAFTEDLGGTLGVVSGTSHCSVDGRGYQGRVDWDRPTFSFFASLRVFDYDEYDCLMDITSIVPPGNGNGNGNGNGAGLPVQARGRALGHRLAAASVDAVTGASSRLVPREAALLDSTAGLGFTTPVAGQWIGGAELYRDVEKLDGSDTLTGLVFAGRRLSDTWSLELSLGYSLADTIDDTAFAGVRFTAAL